VYISGRPGAGKSSLAFPLAAELGYSLVTKDLVKEALHDALYVPGSDEFDLAWSRRLGAASFSLLWTLAAHAGDMVIEANFDPHNDEALGQLRGLGGPTVEVHCACPAEVAHARYNARSRHEVHQGTLPLSAMDKYDRPVGIGPLITVDTAGPVAVAAEVRRLHTSSGRSALPACVPLEAPPPIGRALASVSMSPAARRAAAGCATAGA
jgi:predicted kinase